MTSLLPCRKADIVFITWEDACGDSTRAHQDVIKSQQLAINTNVGWLVHENEKRIVLAHGISTTGEIDHLVIPVVSILERVYPFRPKPRCSKQETKPQDAASPEPEHP